MKTTTKTTTRTPAQAEHQLTHVADRFDHWRQTRTTPAEPIPQYLWEQAIALTTTFSIARVATRLQVSGEELKQRCTAHHAALATPASTALGFVEVPAAPAWPLPTSIIELDLCVAAGLVGEALAQCQADARADIEIELQRPDGARLRIAAQEPHLPLLAVVRAFLETP